MAPDLPPQQPSGYEWMGKFMEAYAAVQFQVAWMTFTIGQTGVAMHFDKAEGRLAVENMKNDRLDLKKAMNSLDIVCQDMIANAERNLRANAERNRRG